MHFSFLDVFCNSVLLWVWMEVFWACWIIERGQRCLSAETLNSSETPRPLSTSRRNTTPTSLSLSLAFLLFSPPLSVSISVSGSVWEKMERETYIEHTLLAVHTVIVLTGGDIKLAAVETTGVKAGVSITLLFIQVSIRQICTQWASCILFWLVCVWCNGWV